MCIIFSVWSVCHVKVHRLGFVPWVYHLARNMINTRQILKKYSHNEFLLCFWIWDIGNVLCQSTFLDKQKQLSHSRELKQQRFISYSCYLSIMDEMGPLIYIFICQVPRLSEAPSQCCYYCQGVKGKLDNWCADFFQLEVTNDSSYVIGQGKWPGHINFP